MDSNKDKVSKIKSQFQEYNYYLRNRPIGSVFLNKVLSDVNLLNGKTKPTPKVVQKSQVLISPLIEFTVIYSRKG